MMSSGSPLALKRRLDASHWDYKHGVDDWVLDLRRICLDNLTCGAMERRRPTLKERLFPLSSGATLTMRDVLYAGAVWTTGVLALCFVVGALLWGGLAEAVGLTLVVALAALPLLVAWTGLGYRHVRRRGRRARESD